MNGHVDRPSLVAQCRGVIARTSFFVLYSVLKVRSPARRQAARHSSRWLVGAGPSLSSRSGRARRVVTLGRSLGGVNLRG